MNKLLKVSLIAMLAVGPVSAFAAAQQFMGADGVTKQNAAPTAQEMAARDKDVASTGYVIGAYNDAIAAVNAVDNVKLDKSAVSPAAISSNSDDTTVPTAGAVYNAISNRLTETDLSGYAGNGVEWADSKFNVDLQANSGLDVTSDGLALDAATKSSLAKADGAVLGTNVDSGLSWNSSTGKLTANVQSVGAGTSAGQIAVNGSDITIVGEGKTLSGAYIIDSTITAGKLESSLQTSINSIANKLDASAANVQSAGNYIATGTGVAGNLQALDTALGKLTSNGNYMDSTATVAANLSALDTQLKSVADNALTSAAITNAYSASNDSQAVTGKAVNSAISGTTVTVHTTWGSTATATATNVLSGPATANQ